MLDFQIVIVFCIVYLGMILGNIPGLVIDRTGIALLGAIAIILINNLSMQEAVKDIDLDSIAILFSFMIISAQFYFSGFYTFITEKVGNWKISPENLLLTMILLAGILSAVLINDIVCLAMTPLIINICSNKKLNPVPYLLGLACGSNVGSALTLIGNPQNMLIGQVLEMPFGKYMIDSFVPCLLGLGICFLVIKWQTKGNWHHENHEISLETPSYNPWQSKKGIIFLIVILFTFLFVDFPREYISLAVAGCLLLSRQMATQTMLSFIDWQLLVLFIGLFIVNHEFNQTEIMQNLLTFLKDHNIDLKNPAWLFPITVFLSNIISNVPAIMLLLPFADNQSLGALLALASTLAGNMFLIGSLANIIVVSQAAKSGIIIDWKKHLQVGLPISLMTLALAALWLYLRSL